MLSRPFFTSNVLVIVLGLFGVVYLIHEKERMRHLAFRSLRSPLDDHGSGFGVWMVRVRMDAREVLERFGRLDVAVNNAGSIEEGVFRGGLTAPYR